MQDEQGYVIKSSKETSYLFLSYGSWHVLNDSYFVWINLNASLSHYKPQLLAKTDSESAFSRIQL